MKLKEFKIGDKVYRAFFKNNNTEISFIREGIVTKIGRKYITADFNGNSSRFEETVYDGEFCLSSNSDYEGSKLFKYKKDIDTYIVKKELDRKIFCEISHYSPARETLKNVQTMYNLLTGKFQVNKQYIAECTLPGYTIADNYVVLACSIEEVLQRLNTQFPGVYIKNICEINMDCIFEKGRTAYSPLLDIYSPCNIQKVWPK